MGPIQWTWKRIFQGIWCHRCGGETRGAHVDGHGKQKETGKVRVEKNVGDALGKEKDEVE
jgi:hypothetical protein